MYVAKFYLKDVQVDSYNEGCDPDTARTFEYKHTMEAETLSELLNDICEWFSVTPDNFAAWEEDPGRLDIQVLETDDGEAAGKHDQEQWKAGKKQLWLAEYTATISQTAPVDLTKAVVHVV